MWINMACDADLRSLRASNRRSRIEHCARAPKYCSKLPSDCVVRIIALHELAGLFVDHLYVRSGSRGEE